MAFERVLVGVDGSPPSLIALRQAIRLRTPGGRLTALTVADSPRAARRGFGAQRDATRRQAEVEAARDVAAVLLAGLDRVETQTFWGSPGPSLTTLAGHNAVDLVAVGAHEWSRAAAFLLGSVASQLLHQAHCAVLFARPCDDPAGFPQRILVGVDGSEHSERAVVVAVELAVRLDASVRVIAAEGGKHIDRAAVRAPVPGKSRRHRIRPRIASQCTCGGLQRRGPGDPLKPRPAWAARTWERERTRRAPGRLLGAGHPPTAPGQGAAMMEPDGWTFFTNYAHILYCISLDPNARLRDLAARVGITERAAQRIVRELVRSGYVSSSRDGRRNRYKPNLRRPLRHPLESHTSIGDIIDLLRTADRRTESR